MFLKMELRSQFFFNDRLGYKENKYEQGFTVNVWIRRDTNLKTCNNCFYMYMQ